MANSTKKSNNQLLYNLYEDSREDKVIKGYLDSNISFYMHGPTGVGKSSRIKAIDPQRIVIYLRNATPEIINGKTVYAPPVDGVYTDSEDGMEDYKPTWLVKLEKLCNEDKDHLHIVFFDELSNAFPSIQGFIFNIMLSKEVNGIWRLPENARVVAAGNETLDSLAAHEISKPLFSRLAHVYVKDDYKSWINWASKKGLNPLVTTFMAYTKGEYLRTKYNGMTPNADPRKWEMVSNVLNESGNLQVLYTLVDKEIVDLFIKFCFRPMVPVKAIIENNLWDECLKAVSNISNEMDYYAFVANMSYCPVEYIRDCYGVISKLPPEYIDLFNKIWIKNDPERFLIIDSLSHEREKVLRK